MKLLLFLFVLCQMTIAQNKFKDYKLSENSVDSILARAGVNDSVIEATRKYRNDPSGIFELSRIHNSSSQSSQIITVPKIQESNVIKIQTSPLSRPHEFEIKRYSGYILIEEKTIPNILTKKH